MNSDYAQKRVNRLWWTVVDGHVRELRCYSCPTMWWCPEAGYSLSEECHLFKTEKEALLKAIKETRRARDIQDKLLKSIQQRLKEVR